MAGAKPMMPHGESAHIDDERWVASSRISKWLHNLLTSPDGLENFGTSNLENIRIFRKNAGGFFLWIIFYR